MARPIATAALCFLIILFYVFELAFPAFPGMLSLSAAGAIERPWTPVTYMFIHDPSDPGHIIFNLFGLALFGSVLESIAGSRRFLMVFFASGIVSGIAGTLFYTSLIGASGAIFGILGTLGVIRPRMMVWAMGVPVPMIAAIAIWAAADSLGFFVPDSVAHASHLTGMATGIVYGIIIRPLYREKPRKKPHPLSDPEMDEWEEKWMKIKKLKNHMNPKSGSFLGSNLTT